MRRRHRATNDEPAIVGHVEPLVGVGGPGVGELDAGDRCTQLGLGGSPEAERAVDVEPAAVLADARSAIAAQRIEGAGVHVAGLGADDRRDRSDAAAIVAQRVGPHPALLVGRRRDVTRLAAEAEHPQRGVDRRRALLADEEA